MKRCFGCTAALELGKAMPCAILICSKCRRDHDKLRLAREALGRHLDAHKTEYRKSNPHWPFLNRYEEWAYQEGA